MRSGILVAGIVLLLMGIIGVVVVSGDVSTCNSGTGQLAQDFSSAAASDCGTYAAIEGVAFLFGIIGLILTIFRRGAETLDTRSSLDSLESHAYV